MKLTMKAICAGGLCLLAGCIVQSLHPFYTPSAVVKVPMLAGNWDPIDKDSPTNQPTRAWPLTAKADGSFEWVTYDEDRPGKLQVTFFQVGTNLFCDLLAGDVAEKNLNGYWLFHVAPVHSVARVETNANQLTIIPLNEGWLRRAVLSNEVALAHIKRDDSLIYTATPDDWMKFLGRHGNNTNAFLFKDAYLFRRHR